MAVLALLAACAGGDTTEPSEPTETSIGVTTTEEAQSETPTSTAGTTDSTAKTGPTQLPPPEVTKIAIGQAGFPSVGVIPGTLAEALDTYSNYGLDVEVFHLDSDTQNTQAYLAGQIQVVDSSGQPAIASLRTDDPLVTVWIGRGNMTDMLVVGPDIETADDLRGQSIAVSSFGSLSHGAVLLALSELGIDPSEVTITQIGGGSERAAALQAGSVAAAPLDASELPVLEALGFYPIVDLADHPELGFPRTAVAVSREFMETNPNTVLAVVAAHAEAMSIFLHDPQRAAEVWAEATDRDLEEAIEAIETELSRGWVPTDGRASEGWFEAYHELLVTVEPELAEVDPTEAYTSMFVDQLEQMGVLSELGLPVDELPTSIGGGG